MSIHINAPENAVADTVLLPGDPKRAEFIANKYLEDAKCYNEVRCAYGFTGTYKGKRVSVQASGMGQPSAAIYIHELIHSYKVKNIIRVGSCGSLREDLKIRQLLVAISASTNSAMNAERFRGMQYAATADATLLFACYEQCKKKNLDARFGSVLSSDTFYDDDPHAWKIWAAHGVQGVEMETAQLYTLAAKFSVRALSILTVSDTW
ncbi:purine nucleoside phosphorylase DeoD-type-like [Ylistrum balloti]|uniref:purine nucleoside phosphorylase DeoD-type-like n=1 Tax=Ylistrum balloti TaxID=509963 RepID=UPI0029059433|nr:purine nucleoside phosphorylase DeoD-type-like [Ylistrum balloti]